MSPAAADGWTPPTRRRLRAIAGRLAKRFGPLDPPRAVDPLDELVLTVLSQHTSDLNAERAFESLRRAFPGPWGAVVAASEGAVADAIRGGGLANSKAPRIQAILREVREREGAFDLSRLRSMSDAGAREYLMTLPGIGPKTAAVVLSFALGRDAMPVDTHVHRVAARLRLIPPRASAEKADRILHDLVPEGLRTPMHVGFIRLGREICKAPMPRCRQCPLRDICPTAPRYLAASAGSQRGTATRHAPDRSG
ncbi:MAG TPA: endonuclease III [Actinomycetota bacterium]|nr:endonuclease III [Actinomycetota bacterium]